MTVEGCLLRNSSAGNSEHFKENQKALLNATEYRINNKVHLPSFQIRSMINPPSDTVLKLLDSEARQEIKTILHLMPSTATGFFYAPKVNGGLSLPRFQHRVKLGTLKSAIKIKNSIKLRNSSTQQLKV